MNGRIRYRLKFNKIVPSLNAIILVLWGLVESSIHHWVRFNGTSTSDMHEFLTGEII